MFGKGQVPDSLTIYNAGTSFINGDYTLVSSQKSGKSKMIKYARQCLHPLSKVPFTLEIVNKRMPQFTKSNSNFYVIQGFRNSNSNEIIEYYISDQNSNWNEIAGINPLPKMTIPNNGAKTYKPSLHNNAKTTNKDNSEDSKSNSDTGNIAPTFTRFLLDTYLFSNDVDCKILGIGRDSKLGDYVILNDTIFHPQGGGQPSDIGTIRSKNDSKLITFNVEFVAMDGKTGIIYHYGQYGSDSNDKFSVNDEIIECIDEKVRTSNAKCHSAGHLLDIGMSLIGFGSEIMKPLKGYHFIKGSYVEYLGNIDTNEREKVRTKLENTLNTLIKENINSKVLLMDRDEYCKEYVGNWDSLSKNKQNEIMGSLRANKDNKIRVIAWDNDKLSSFAVDKSSLNKCELGCMCGGTHIDNTERIKEIKITKFKKKGKNLRVQYTVV